MKVFNDKVNRVSHLDLIGRQDLLALTKVYNEKHTDKDVLAEVVEDEIEQATSGRKAILKNVLKRKQ